MISSVVKNKTFYAPDNKNQKLQVTKSNKQSTFSKATEAVKSPQTTEDVKKSKGRFSKNKTVAIPATEVITPKKSSKKQEIVDYDKIIKKNVLIKEI